MASQVDICNYALVSLGATTIASITEESEEARACNSVYELIRKDLLRSHNWNFATDRVALSQLTTPTPSFEFDYYYSLPSDYLKLVKTSLADNVVYRVEGLYIATSASAISIEYIKDVTDTAKFDDSYVMAFAKEIASAIAYKVTESSSLSKTRLEESIMKRKQSKAIDSQEGTPRGDRDNNWLTQR